MRALSRGRELRGREWGGGNDTIDSPEGSFTAEVFLVVGLLLGGGSLQRRFANLIMV